MKFPLLALLFLVGLPPAHAAADERAECTCAGGQASYHYLKCPRAAPADPDPCPIVHDNMHPHRPLPKEWHNLCFDQRRMDCFLRRHAASWRISCSVCATEKCCPFPNWHNCPECHGEKQEMPRMLEEAARHAADLKEAMRNKKLEVAASPGYVIVSDLPNIKIATAAGNPRIATSHELLHLYLQRAEMARRDFEKVFGRAHHGMTCLVITKSDRDSKKLSKHFWGSEINVMKGYGKGEKTPWGAGNGLAISGKNDDDLHFEMRHLLGHILMSCYVEVNPFEKHLPHWLDKGAAHWLCKLHPRAEDYATFCSHEGGGGGVNRGGGGGFGGRGGRGGGASSQRVNGSGARWDVKARKLARKGPNRDPVEAMFQASTFKQMDFDMHVRAWSWFDVFTREERDPFVAFVRSLRKAEEPRIAAKAAWGEAPELVDQRWRDRVLGKRRAVEATEKEKAGPGELGAASDLELRNIENEPDMDLLASRIRGLEKCKNVKSAKLLIELVDARDSDRVREVIALVLARTTDEEALAYLRGEGYERAGNLGRATLCRLYGEWGDKKSVETLRDALGDGFWLVRANAARALGQIGDEESVAKLTAMARSEGVGKVRVAAIDALGALGDAAKPAVHELERNLMNKHWQVKVTACAALASIGDTAAVESLIGRLDLEGGRVHDAILETLKALTGMDRPEWRTETWREWWKKAKKFADLEKKSREELGQDPDAPEPRAGDRYAKKSPPTYYGIKVYARTVGYVLDVSASMKGAFLIDPVWEDRLGHKFTSKTRIGVSKEELVHSIQTLDPRTRLNLVFFNERARMWKSTPVQAGAMGSNAVKAVQNIQPKGQTNYYDALRLILGLEKGSSGWNPNFADTPDTLFFLTDGSPTDGDITKADELLAWFREKNRFARLRVHVIAMGTSGVDFEFLRKFATQNGGQFVHLTGTY